MYESARQVKICAASPHASPIEREASKHAGAARHTCAHTGGARYIDYKVGGFWVIIVFNFPPRIFRFTGRTTPRSKQEMIPQGVNFVDF